MNFTPLKNLLPRAAASKGISNEFRAIAVCNAFESILSQIFPENEIAAGQIQIRFYKDKTLHLRVPSSIFASEIAIRKEKILTRLNAKLKEGTVKVEVKDIRTSV